MSANVSPKNQSKGGGCSRAAYFTTLTCSGGARAALPSAASPPLRALLLSGRTERLELDRADQPTGPVTATSVTDDQPPRSKATSHLGDRRPSLSPRSRGTRWPRRSWPRLGWRWRLGLRFEARRPRVPGDMLVSPWRIGDGFGKRVSRSAFAGCPCL